MTPPKLRKPEVLFVNLMITGLEANIKLMKKEDKRLVELYRSYRHRAKDAEAPTAHAVHRFHEGYKSLERDFSRQVREWLLVKAYLNGRSYASVESKVRDVSHAPDFQKLKSLVELRNYSVFDDSVEPASFEEWCREAELHLQSQFGEEYKIAQEETQPIKAIFDRFLDASGLTDLIKDVAPTT